jgi:hypothetical protein
MPFHRLTHPNLFIHGVGHHEAARRPPESEPLEIL